MYHLKEPAPESNWKEWLDKWFYWLFVAGILVNASGLLLPVLEPDGALYASISKNMVLSGDYLNLRVEGRDWLDKPHFPFWITAASFKIFGINSFAYKFPAILFWLAGSYFTYTWSTKLYGRQTGLLTLLIYVSVEHLILSNNDVRAEPYLTGLTIGAAYYYWRTYRENRWIFILPGSMLMAMAVMTKGLFVPLIVAGGFLMEWIFKKKWTAFFNPRWWLAIILVFLFITPELYSLYEQFDLHPEKIVFGTKQVSGLQFFFWDSQFGRFLNTGPIKGKGDLLFYFHTLLWAFLPWSVFPFLLLIQGIRKIKDGINMSSDYICSGIFLSGFVIFSLSRFQLPHYLNILYPFLSIPVAHYLFSLRERSSFTFLIYFQNFLYFLLPAATILLIYFFGPQPAFILMPGLLLIFFLIWKLFPGKDLTAIVGRSVAAVLIVNLVFNAFLYPVLFRYEAGISAAAYLEKNKYAGSVYVLNEVAPEFSFEFYSRQPVKYLKRQDLDSLKDPVLLFTPEFELDSLRKEGIQITKIQSFPHFHISMLTGKFINRQSRDQVVDSTVLAIVDPH